ncbi:MAG: serine hydrolase [Leptolyngbya sp. RL_3_1]|nr:serine hydrolase [Leptolyngbya sp. RL_3_1]
MNSLDFLWRLLCLATAYKAKLLCSGVFVSQRDPQSLLNQDLAVDELFFLRFISTTIDAEAQTVTASIFGLARRTALYRPGLGSTLVIDTTLEALRQQVPDLTLSSQRPAQKLLPRSLAPAPPLSPSLVLQSLDRAFAEPRRQRTRAVAISQGGALIAERYAPGFTANLPLLGWSMTKSVVNALVGILVHQGQLALDQCALLPEWDTPEDPRRAITLDQLLRMRSGLQFEEVYSDPRSHVTTMLFQRGDAAAYAAGLPLADSTGAWSYASGTTNILCRIIRQVLGDSLADYWAFPHRALFEPLGMTSAVLEPDAAGTFVGSSFMYATARDWLKLGQLYLQDGCWQGRRLLPEGWVQYSTTPSDPGQRYGAHFWRQVPFSFASRQVPRPTFPQIRLWRRGIRGKF